MWLPFLLISLQYSCRKNYRKFVCKPQPDETIMNVCGSTGKDKKSAHDSFIAN